MYSLFTASATYTMVFKGDSLSKAEATKIPDSTVQIAKQIVMASQTCCLTKVQLDD